MENIKTRTILCGSPKSSMMVEDLKSILKEINPNASIIEIDYRYNENLQNQIIDAIKYNESIHYYINNHVKNSIVSGYPILFCASAYVSTDEFPENEYYLDETLSEGDTRKPLPIKEVLKRDAKVFIDCGFININNWINYEHQIAFIYPNKIGMQVFKEIQKLNLERELDEMFPETDKEK